MSDFSKRPFVAGSLIGLRSFDVDPLGRLVGPSYPQVFQPGENLATCYHSSAMAIQMSQLERSIARMSGKPVPPRPALPEARKGHQVGSVTCGCGFYAYFDGTNTYERRDRITAVVEGYGVCSVGDRGFRAEKARLVALIDPGAGGRKHPAWFDRLSDWSYPHDVIPALGGISLGMAGLVVLVLSFAALPLSLGLLPVGVAAITACVALFMACGHGITRHYPDLHTLRTCHDSEAKGIQVDRVRANYPEVPVYRSVAAALREHPLTPPPAPPVPTPESREDFWTMEAPR